MSYIVSVTLQSKYLHFLQVKFFKSSTVSTGVQIKVTHSQVSQLTVFTFIHISWWLFYLQSKGLCSKTTEAWKAEFSIAQVWLWDLKKDLSQEKSLMCTCVHSPLPDIILQQTSRSTFSTCTLTVQRIKNTFVSLFARSHAI